MRLSVYLEGLATRAIQATFGEESPALVRPADPAHGDYQVNGAMPLAKRLKKPPREMAAPIAEALRAEDAIASAQVAGPGFINLRLSRPWLATRLAEMGEDVGRDGVPAVDHPERVVVDFSAPNIAKQMHVGHIRSTIIGDALCRLLRFAGHQVTGDNHVGDWGTLFGLLIVGMRRFGDPQALHDNPIEELERVYKEASALAKEDEAVADEARAELAKLQKGDAENLALWKQFVGATRVELDRIYERLDVHFDMWRGESAYEEMLPDVIQTLLAQGIAREDQGAICVFFEDDPELKKVDTPFIVRKKDGAYLYSTTDIASVLWRRDELHADRILYVVDKRQSLHFKQLFATVRKLGVEMGLEHVSFGTIVGKDGKPLRTRSGTGLIKLADLLDEAEERAAALMQEELEVDSERLRELARVVGIGAIKYADLSQNRQSDYRFDWDKLISFKGNASPYLQYAHARVCSIFRRGEVDPAGLAGVSPSLDHEAELALGRQLLRFPDAVHHAAETSQPHLVAEHLYALAREFSGFFEQCPVLKAEGATRDGRLLLCWLTARQLRRGLSLLGIEAPDRM
ncbi:MAG: arginine--tRNA ligase [Myxococcales bacterium]|jgi:arginyl-tRNA synthetase